MTSTGVVLLAAGSGQRFGGRIPKQFLSLNGEPLFVASLRVFGSVSSVKEIVVVAPPEGVGRLRRRLPRLPSRVSLMVVEGGAFRGASVRNGVVALSPLINVVLIHDAARPMVTPDIIRRVETAARRTGAALAAWPLADTLKKERSQRRVGKTIRRAGLWLAQTPQGFRREVALKCLLKPSPQATDDVSLVEARRMPVEIVEGSPMNIKVTTPHDLQFCRAMI